MGGVSVVELALVSSSRSGRGAVPPPPAAAAAATAELAVTAEAAMAAAVVLNDLTRSLASSGGSGLPLCSARLACLNRSRVSSVGKRSRPRFRESASLASVV